MYSSYDRALLTIFAPQPSASAKKKKHFRARNKNHAWSLVRFYAFTTLVTSTGYTSDLIHKAP